MADKKGKKSVSVNSAPWRDSRLTLKQPHLTEKATRLEGKERTYTFKVSDSATKVDIAKAVSARFGVEVEAVRLVKIPARTKRIGRTLGWTGDFKKAYVKLKPGEKLETR